MKKALIIIIAAIVVISGIGYYLSEKAQAPTSAQNSNTTVSTTTTTTSSTSDWKTYSNTKYGFNFQYPADFQVEAEGFTDIGLIADNMVAPPYQSLTHIYIDVYQSYKDVIDATENAGICGSSSEPSPFSSSIKSADYACGDAGTTESRHIIALPNGMALFVSVTSDSIEPTTSLTKNGDTETTTVDTSGYKDIPATTIAQILASLKLTK